MPNLVMPHNLSRESLVQIVTSVRDLLYYDVDDADREFWNPEKIWDTGHIFQRIGETLEEYNLVPMEEVPCDLESDNLPRLIDLARSNHVTPEALEDLVRECAGMTASNINNEGLDSQIQFLVEQLGEAEVRTRLDEIGSDADHPPVEVRLPCFGMVVRLERPSSATVARAGTIASDLIDACGPECNEPSRAAFHAIESLVLAHACAGLDIASPAYIEGIETAVEAIVNNV